LEEKQPYAGPPLIQSAVRALNRNKNPATDEELKTKNQTLEAIRASESHFFRKLMTISYGLKICDGYIILAHDVQPVQNVSADILFHSDVLGLKLGYFSRGDDNIDFYKAYFGARIYVPKKFVAPIMAQLPIPPRPGGRPEHLAKAWYVQQGCERSGRSFKELQLEMIRADFDPPPSVTTIRQWEKEFKRMAGEDKNQKKLPSETP